MANTYTQMHIQLVFAVKFRRCAILKSWRADLFKYITGIVRSNGHKLLCINGVEDHIHILLGLRPNQSVSALVQEIKSASSRWVNDQRLARGGFYWQEGFAAFSYTMGALPNVIRYIEGQEEHHKKKSFREEYISLLKEFNITFKEEYIFHDGSEGD